MAPLASPAAQAAGPHRVKFDNSKWQGDLPPVCGPDPAVPGFAMSGALVADREFIVKSSTSPNGTLTQRIAGKLVVKFTNEDSGKSVTIDASGPYTLETRPNGGQTFRGEGRSLNLFGPKGRRIAGKPGAPLPGLVLSTGRTTVRAEPSPTNPKVLVAQSFSATGKVIDVCAMLR